MSGRYALVIGNTEYTDPGLLQLSAPKVDAQDFARVLADGAICAFDDVKVLINEPSSSVIEAIDAFFDAKKPDDLLVLYFSGHGVRDELGSLYLAFKNTLRTRLRATAIKSDYVRESMDESRSKRQVIILDCCNSGAFPQGTKAEIGGHMGLASAFQGYGRFVLMASDATQFAWEGDKVIGKTEKSLFTHFLVKGLEGEADTDGDGKITVDDLYDYAFEEISKVTSLQTPTKAASRVKGEFILRRMTRLEDIKPIPLPGDLLDEIDDTRPYVREAVVQKLQKILDGRNIGMARSALAALQRIAADENTTRRIADEAARAFQAYHRAPMEEEQADVAPAMAESADVLPPQLQPPTETPVSDEATLPARLPITASEPVAALQSRPGTSPAPANQIRPRSPLWRRPLVWIGVIAALAVIGYMGLSAFFSPPSGATPTLLPTEVASSVPVATDIPTEPPATLAPSQGLADTAIPVTGTGPHIGTPVENIAAWEQGTASLDSRSVKVSGSSDSPGTVLYNAALSPSDAVRWEWNWCAKDQVTLDDNLNNINLKFELDGQDVTTAWHTEDYTLSSLNCRVNFILLSKWPRGTFHLTITTTLHSLVDDGTAQYAPGVYLDQNVVTVQ